MSRYLFLSACCNFLGVSFRFVLFVVVNLQLYDLAVIAFSNLFFLKMSILWFRTIFLSFK